MTRLLTDQEVADQLGIPIATLRSWRYLERGEVRDRLPRWVDKPGGKRRQVLGTPQEEVDKWIQRNLTKGAA